MVHLTDKMVTVSVQRGLKRFKKDLSMKKDQNKNNSKWNREHISKGN
jgi:hypothetical protein